MTYYYLSAAANCITHLSFFLSFPSVPAARGTRSTTKLVFEQVADVGLGLGWRKERKGGRKQRSKPSRERERALKSGFRRAAAQRGRRLKSKRNEPPKAPSLLMFVVMMK
jgi:hypothetical protein